MTEDIKFDDFLDAKDLICPLPMLNTRKALKLLSEGQVLKVETIDAGLKNDLTSWAKKTGHEILKFEELSSSFIFYIKKNT